MVFTPQEIEKQEKENSLVIMLVIAVGLLVLAVLISSLFWENDNTDEGNQYNPYLPESTDVESFESDTLWSTGTVESIFGQLRETGALQWLLEAEVDDGRSLNDVFDEFFQQLINSLPQDA